MKKIKISRDRVAYKGKFISLIEREFVGVHGKQGKWEMIKRKTKGDIVSIVPITPQKEIILTKIYRIPLKKFIIELCAGLADKNGESSVTLARRELREETGYVADKFISLAAGVFNAGLSTDRMRVYLAKDAHKVGNPQHENGEQIEVLTVPLSRAYYFLTHQPKNIEVDLKLFGVLYLLQKYGYQC